MGKFKPLKELVKALTYIGDAIAGTNKSSNSQGGSGDVYDGILEVADGSKITYLSFGIKDNDNATKLGDLFSDNFINDLNNKHNIDVVSTVTKLDDTKIQLKAINPGTITPTPTIYKDGSVIFSYITSSGNPVLIIRIYDKDYIYGINLTDEELTKDTPLMKHSL